MQANTMMVDGTLVPIDENVPAVVVAATAVETAREALGLAIGRTDLARQVISEGGAADMGAIISDLERAEQALDAADKALAG